MDAGRLAAVRGRKAAAKGKGNRDGYRCSEARDIGAYDTCPHGCVYCYAVRNRPLALERFRSYNIRPSSIQAGETIPTANGDWGRRAEWARRKWRAGK